MPIKLHVSETPINLHVSDQGPTPLHIGSPFVIKQSPIAENGLPEGGTEGDVLMKYTNTDYVAQWVHPADHAESDNTRPITSAGVYREIGNINALLAII